MAEGESVELLDRCRAGDEQAAQELFERFAERLIAIAAARLSENMARRIDPEDVVQSAYRSFFIGVRGGRYALQRSGDLWRLLVGITLHKLQGQVEYHTAGKRALAQERAAPLDDSALGLANLVLAREPSPLEAAALTDEIEYALRHLEAHHRPIVELRLQGHSLEEIATELKCSERTVRRVLEKVKRILRQGI